MSDILSINSVSKRFGEVTALDSVTFSLDEGKVLGLLGPNGAGKTTLLRIINGIQTPDAGEVRFRGEKVSLKMSGRIGYMPEERGLYENLTVEEQIMYFGRLHGADRRTVRDAMERYLEIFGLSGDRHRKIKELSKGNGQKVQIIATLAHKPELVMLDEPFSGFDPLNAQVLQTLIADLRSNGISLILSSHNMPALEEMCDEIALVNHGRLLVKESIGTLKERFKNGELIVTTGAELNCDYLNVSDRISEIRPVAATNGRNGYSYRLRKSPDVSNLEILNLIGEESDLLHFEEALPSLSEIFIKFTKL